MLLDVVDVLLVVEPTRCSSMSELATDPTFCRRRRRSRFALSFVDVLISFLDVLALHVIAVIAPHGSRHG